MKKSNSLISAFLIIAVAAIAVYLDRREQPEQVVRSNPAPIASKVPVVWAPFGLKSAGEIVIEIYKTVFESDLKDPKLILQYADAITQGASLEGIYNGLVHSGFYRELESKNPGPASPAALQYFAQELFLIETALPEKTFFTEKSAGVLGHAMDYGELENAASNAAPVSEESPRPQSAADFEQIFKNSSYFTLKRVLGDELMKQVGVLSTDKTALANWYSRFAVRHAGLKIDFGLPQRNQSDEAFHKAWALSAPTDRLTWEVLNRVQRVLNAKKR